MSSELITHAASAVSSTKGTVAVAATTAGIGTAELITLTNGWLGLVAILCSIFATSLLAMKHNSDRRKSDYELEMMKLQASKQTGRREEDKKAPTKSRGKCRN